ncbi:MAG: 4Fe-4S binding protein, partial [Clostridia bacterium]|nr:4Fe-4S binding protein [Clostridia bacterium]
TFRDDRLPFTEEQVKAEAARCLSCGAARVDRNICIGCGLCTTRCKFDAIHLHKEFDEYGDVYEKLIFNILKKDIKKWNGIMLNRAKSAIGK